MRLKSILAGFAMAIVAVLPAQAQRGGGGPGSWELLGEEKVGFGSDRDRIEIRQNEAWWREKSFRALRFVATGGDVKIRRIILSYQNGHTEQLDFQGDIRAGQQVDVPLRGERSYLAAIDFDYASRFNLRFGSGGLQVGQATMRVYGENMRAGPPPVRPTPPPPVVAPGGRGTWETIATARFDRRDANVEIPVGRREGRFGQFRLLYNGDGGIVIRGIRVRFANGQTQEIPLAERLEDGYSTRGIDIDGDRRFIERVFVQMEPRGRPGRANFTVEATERPGREVSEPPRRGEARFQRQGWELLGRRPVDVRGDRDVIVVQQQSAAWWGQRGFDKLHFTAENSEIFLNRIRVVFQNGFAEEIRVNQLIREGADLSVDLPGQRSYVREIEMFYRSRPNVREQAVMSVFGERSRR